MRLNLNFKIKDFNNQEIVNSQPISKTVANALAMNRSKDPMKIMHIATKLYNEGEIELDSSDLDFFAEEIKKIEGFTNILSAHILEAIDKAKTSK